MAFSVFVVDHVGWLPANTWSEPFSAAACQQAQMAFNDLLSSSRADPRFRPALVRALPGTPRSNEPVVHLVRDLNQSIIASLGGVPTAGMGGGTVWLRGRMISEVYVQLSTRDRIAGLMVHEIMHNKIDSHPSRRLIRDIHRLQGPPGFHSNPNLVPRWTRQNSEVMLRALSIDIPQHYDPAHGVPPPK
jgi:hypothetical protein